MRSILALLLLATTANAQWIRDGQWYDRIPDPLPLGNGFASFNPTEAEFLATGARRVTQDEIDARAAEAEAAASAAEAARIGGLAQAYGGIVSALRMYLVIVGWDIPCEAAQVTVDLVQRAVSDTLTAEQVRAQGAIADLYTILQGAGVSNADIAAIWEVLQ